MSAATELRPALLRAAKYRALHLLLRPPTSTRQEELRALADDLSEEEEVNLRPVLDQTDEQVEAEGFRVLKPAGPVSLSSSNYIRDGYADMGPILGDVAGFYHAFGYEPFPGESPDHFASLAGFLSHVCLKEAWATNEGDEEGAEICRDAEAKLLAEHVMPYLLRLAETLSEAAPEGGYYTAVAEIITQLASSEGETA